MGVRLGRPALTQSAKPLATVTLCRGRYSATFATDHALNREVLAAVLDFIEDRERKQAA